MFWCSNIQMFKHSNVQNVHMHRDSSGRGVRSNWWFWIGVCAALLVSAATDQGTPLLGRILLLRLFSHLILFHGPVFCILFYILFGCAAFCLCLLQPLIKKHRFFERQNFFLGRAILSSYIGQWFSSGVRVVQPPVFSYILFLLGLVFFTFHLQHLQRYLRSGWRKCKYSCFFVFRFVAYV